MIGWVAMYLAAAEILNEAESRTVLPIGAPAPAPTPVEPARPRAA